MISFKKLKKRIDGLLGHNVDAWAEERGIAKADFDQLAEYMEFGMITMVASSKAEGNSTNHAVSWCMHETFKLAIRLGWELHDSEGNK